MPEAIKKLKFISHATDMMPEFIAAVKNQEQASVLCCKIGCYLSGFRCLKNIYYRSDVHKGTCAYMYI